MRKIIISAFFLLGLSTSFFSQETYVNQLFRDSFGQPVFSPLLNPLGVQWSQSIPSTGGGIITIAHTNISGQGENILLTKTDLDGNIIFQTSSYNVSGTSNEYGIGIYESASGDIYVCGTTDANGSTDYDGVILRYNSSGTLQNSTIFSGSSNLNDIASALMIHPNTGNLIVALTNENTGTSYDYMVLELNPISLSVINQNTYDGAGLPDIALGLEIEAGSGNIMIIGGSQSSAVVSAYAIAFFTQTLTYLSDTRTDLTGSPYDQPLAYKKNGNEIFITGKTMSGTTYNVKTVKINSSYNIAWSVTYDYNGLDDLANTIDVDPTNGDVIIGGLAGRTSSASDMFVIRYNSSGAMVGSPYLQQAENPSGNALIKKIASSPSGNVYFIGGESGLGGQKQVVIGKINKSGTIGWEKKVSSTTQDILPSDIELNSGKTFAISVIDSVIDKYLLTGYNELILDTTRKFISGKPCWKRGELLVEFNPVAINKTTINNDDLKFGDLKNFLTSTANSILNDALIRTCRECDIKALKIFSLKTTDTLAITRQGENEVMPSFWSTLLLKLPPTITENQAQSIFNSLKNIVLNTQLNNFIELTSVPNDSLYNLQGSLHPVSPYNNAHINVEEAWDVVTNCGSSTVKGGVFDTGIMFRHKDLAYAGNGTAFPNDTAGQYKLQGWYFASGFPTSATNNGVNMRTTQFGITDFALDPLDHGTKVAGIIAAKRNNTSGVAGIAGGGNVSSNPGTKLYSLNVAASNAHWLISAYYEAHTGVGNRPPNQVKPYAYGVDFSNHSYKLVPGWWPIDSFPIFSKQVHWANRLGVTFIASRGNDSTNNYVVPATIDPDWAISVGGSNTSGTKWSGSSYGLQVDVIAPAVPYVVQSTSNSRGYGFFSGTSSAAPHASGVVALLMSYMNDANNKYMNLNPEDCDFIIQRSATDVGTLGYDSINGYGRLNAGKALRMVEKPFRILYHFGTNPRYSYSITKTLQANWDTVHLTEAYESKTSPSVSYAKGKYIVKTFRIDATVTHAGLYPTDSLMYYWPRHSKSNVYALPSAQKRINLHEKVIINSLGPGSANLTGYVYQVKDSTGTNILGWWPCDTTFAALASNSISLMEYSVLTKNKAVGIHEYSKEEEKRINLFPNPAKNQQTIQIDCEKESDCKIELFDIMGRFIKNVYEGRISAGKNSISHSVAGLPNSLYIYMIKIDGKTNSRKFIKD